ncbi:putative mannose binding [Diaporthe ampelina]|uniref:Putative mannose binding n=1 Tax=Diaporthe ampelina TaxID=1214573 RepID=A0A0G2HTM2_9PEZI|nr:putative mannose binding [Diaporthe ampelina]
MQLIKFIVASMALAISASPIDQQGADLVNREATPDGWVEVAASSEKRDDPNQLFRRDFDCAITGSSVSVQCRECTSDDCDIVTTYRVGEIKNFKCAARGQCVTLDGVTDCTWGKVDRKLRKDCWVNNVYTDSGCTLEALGTDC